MSDPTSTAARVGARAAPGASARRRAPYVRPMQGWWRRDPFFVKYMVREFTALAVAAYAGVLTVGVVRLGQGPEAWAGYTEALRSPWSLAFHAVLLWAMVLHGKSWFEIMPKTIPYLYVGGRKVAASTITRAGWAVTVAASVVVLGLAAWGGTR